MTREQQMVVYRALDLATRMYGSLFLNMECSPVVSKSSTLFPVVVWLDSRAIGCDGVGIRRVFQTMADLEAAAQRSLPR